MLIETLIAAPCLPGAFDLAPCVGENGTILRLNLNLIAKLLNDLFKASLGYIGPDTQDV
jgi:hypothetical protein